MKMYSIEASSEQEDEDEEEYFCIHLQSCCVTLAIIKCQLEQVDLTYSLSEIAINASSFLI